MGGGLFIGVELGDRRYHSTEAWGRISRALLSEEEAINEEKNKIEGKRQSEHISLGFAINTEDVTICLPEEKELAPPCRLATSSPNLEVET